MNIVNYNPKNYNEWDEFKKCDILFKEIKGFIWERIQINLKILNQIKFPIAT